MGIRFSSSQAAPSESSPASSLGELPESCVAQIMTYMDPPQICKLATLNRAFRGASSADFVWESKLPPNYDVLLRRIFADFPSHLGKRGIYARLCRLNSLDDGTKKVWLDRGMGKLCLCVSAKGLSITGIDDRRNWNHIPTDESSRMLSLHFIPLFEVVQYAVYVVQRENIYDNEDCTSFSIVILIECLGVKPVSSPLFADSAVLHTSSKSGGLKWMGKLSSHFQLGNTAYSSEYIWGEPARGLDDESATPSMFMVGTKSLYVSSYGLQMDSMLHPSVF
ncbi:hypothetical protein JHK87_047081 [Glycine soja]|nr:hypothetical protein JHK87_047081 [Glycine soja]